MPTDRRVLIVAPREEHDGIRARLTALLGSSIDVVTQEEAEARVAAATTPTAPDILLDVEGYFATRNPLPRKLKRHVGPNRAARRKAARAARRRSSHVPAQADH